MEDDVRSTFSTRGKTTNALIQWENLKRGKGLTDFM